MPEAWSAKDERQYQHILRSERRRGRSLERAKEIAARTVNQQRRQEGRALDPRDRSTGNPNAPFEERSRDELYNLACERQVPNLSKMNKGELIHALRS